MLHGRFVDAQKNESDARDRSPFEAPARRGTGFKGGGGRDGGGREGDDFTVVGENYGGEKLGCTVDLGESRGIPARSSSKRMNSRRLLCAARKIAAADDDDDDDVG